MKLGNLSINPFDCSLSDFFPQKKGFILQCFTHPGSFFLPILMPSGNFQWMGETGGIIL